MTLPVLTRPIYTTALLSQKESIQYYPFTVAESKLLMMAKEASDINTIVVTLRQILNNCLVDKTIDVNKLPMIDLEWLFIQIYAHSMGEKQPLYFTCSNTDPTTNTTCGMVIELEANLLDAKIVNINNDNKIKVNDNISLIMKLPTFEIEQQLIQANSENDILTSALCIESVIDGPSVHDCSQASVEEMIQFTESLPIGVLDSITQYLDNCPMIKSVYEVDCSKCHFHHKITLEGLEDHF